MIDAFQSGFGRLIMGFSLLTIENILVIAVSGGLLWAGYQEGKPQILVPIGFGAILVNIPLAGMMEPDGRRHYIMLSVLRGMEIDYKFEKIRQKIVDRNLFG